MNTNTPHEYVPSDYGKECGICGLKPRETAPGVYHTDEYDTNPNEKENYMTNEPLTRGQQELVNNYYRAFSTAKTRIPHWHSEVEAVIQKQSPGHRRSLMEECRVVRDQESLSRFMDIIHPLAKLTRRYDCGLCFGQDFSFHDMDFDYGRRPVCKECAREDALS